MGGADRDAIYRDAAIEPDGIPPRGRAPGAHRVGGDSLGGDAGGSHPGAAVRPADPATRRVRDDGRVRDDRERDHGGPADRRASRAGRLDRVRRVHARGRVVGAAPSRRGVGGQGVMSDFAIRLAGAVPADRVLRGAALAPYTTFRVGGPADWLVLASRASEVKAAISAARACGLPVVVLGGGSNVLVADSGVRAVVIRVHGGEAAPVG